MKPLVNNVFHIIDAMEMMIEISNKFNCHVKMQFRHHLLESYPNDSIGEISDRLQKLTEKFQMKNSDAKFKIHYYNDFTKGFSGEILTSTGWMITSWDKELKNHYSPQFDLVQRNLK